MSLNYQKDPAMQAPTLPTGLDGVDSIVRFYQDGTEEVKGILKGECSIIYECSYCRSMFRSIINFLTHKRTICRSLLSAVRMEDALSKHIQEALQRKDGDAPPPPPLEANGGGSSSAAASKVKKAGAFLRRVNMVGVLSRHIRPVNVELPNTKASIEIQTLPKISRPAPMTSFQKGRQVIHHPHSSTAVRDQLPEERTLLVMPQDHSTRCGDMQLRKRRRKGAATAHTSLPITTKEVELLESLPPELLSLGDFHTLRCREEGCTQLEEPFPSIGALVEHLSSDHNGASTKQQQQKRAVAGKVKVKGGGRWPKKVEGKAEEQEKTANGTLNSSATSNSSREATEESELSEEAPLLTAAEGVDKPLDQEQPRRQMQRDRRPTKRIFNEEFAFPQRLSSAGEGAPKKGGARQVSVEAKKQTKRTRTSEEPMNKEKQVVAAPAAAAAVVVEPEEIEAKPDLEPAKEESNDSSTLTPSTPPKYSSEPPELRSSPHLPQPQRGSSVAAFGSDHPITPADNGIPPPIVVTTHQGEEEQVAAPEEGAGGGQQTPTKPSTKDQLPSVLADRHRETLSFYTPRARKARLVGDGEGEGEGHPRRKHKVPGSSDNDPTTPLPPPPPKPEDLTTVPVYLTELQREIFFSPLRPLFSTKAASDGLHQCGECGETLRCLKDGRQHMVGHLRVIRLRCSLCDAGSFFCSDMRIHLMFRHCEKLQLAPSGWVNPNSEVVPCMDKQKADALSQLIDPYHPGRVMYTSGKIVSRSSPRPYLPDPTIEKRILSKSRIAISTKSGGGPSSLHPDDEEEVETPVSEEAL